MVKTTVYLDPETATALKQLAGAQGRKQAELIREALELYTKQHQRPLPQSVGKYRSGRSDVSERATEFYASALKDRR